MALTEEERALRRFSIGGSDANTIMSGDPERILKLWKEKIGDEQPENLDDVLAVQLGSFTEPFNVSWFERVTGRKVTNQGERHVSDAYSFMTCTLDGLTDDGKTIFEAKHVGAFVKEEEVLDRYAPQLHHNMSVMKLESAVLSVIFGNNKYEHFNVTYDYLYGAAVDYAVRKFWEAVTTKTPPTTDKGMSYAIPIKRVDMSMNNRWAALAAQWKENQPAAKLFDEAASEMKSLVEPDVIEAYGHGISIKRDKRGALRLKGV